MQVFAWHCVFASAPEMGSCCRDSWPLATPHHPYASAHMQELLPFIRAFIPEHFYYWALLHSSVSGCSVIRGGRPQRHWSISAPSVLSPHFPSSFHFSAIILFYLALFFFFAHLAPPQTSACRHTWCTHMYCDLSQAHTLYILHCHREVC